MIAVKLIGGLGNQLFQYSAGRALSARFRTELVLDDSWYEGPFLRNTARTVGLRSFRTRARWPTQRERAWMLTCTNRLLSRIPLPRPWRIVKEAHYHFDARFPALPDNVYLSGYWQSERYFAECRDELLEELTPRDRPPAAWHEWAAAIADTESVSVHIRRGDFVASARTAAYHGVLPLSYYGDAVDRISSRFESPTLFVFSDDLAWAQANLALRYPTRFVPRLSADPSWEMFLMSKCRHNIVANSSYSWWGAWLNRLPASTVVAPARWFRDPGIDTSTLIPERWLRI